MLGHKRSYAILLVYTNNCYKILKKVIVQHFFEVKTDFPQMFLQYI